MSRRQKKSLKAINDKVLKELQKKNTEDFGNLFLGVETPERTTVTVGPETRISPVGLVGEGVTAAIADEKTSIHGPLNLDVKIEAERTQIQTHPKKQPIEDDKTQVVGGDDKTQVVGRPTRANPPPRETQAEMPVAQAKPSEKTAAWSSVQQVQRAEYMHWAQSKVIELEKEIERLAEENKDLHTVNQLHQKKIDELLEAVRSMERHNAELKDQNETELKIFRDGLAKKDSEIQSLRAQLEESELKVSGDLRKVRVRERELENRIEIIKVEKAALLRAKDDSLLEAQRKLDQAYSELHLLKSRASDLQRRHDQHMERSQRTMKALRLAIANLEVQEDTETSTMYPIKKAE